MKIVAINGSHKGKSSSTFLMMNEFLNGAKSRGAIIKEYNLQELSINNCNGCFHCWNVVKNKCVFKDDMEQILVDFKDMDILLLGTPLYFDNVSAMLKTFLDRCTSVGSMTIELDKNGESKHLNQYEESKTPKLVIMSNCGFPEQSQFQALDFMMERMARNLSTEIIAKIFRTQGPLLSYGGENLNGIINDYKKLLYQAGVEVIENNSISISLQKKLELPLIPVDVYLNSINKS